MKTFQVHKNLLPALFTTLCMLFFLGAAFAQENAQKESIKKVEYTEKEGETTLTITEVKDGESIVTTYEGEEARARIQSLQSQPLGMQQNAFMFKTDCTDLDVTSTNGGKTTIEMNGECMEIESSSEGTVTVKCMKDTNCMAKCIKLTGDSAYRYSSNGEHFVIQTLGGESIEDCTDLNWDHGDFEELIQTLDFDVNLDDATVKMFFDESSVQDQQVIRDVQVVHSMAEAKELLRNFEVNINDLELKEGEVKAIVVEKRIIIEDDIEESNDLSLEIFKVYPNPNSGLFTIAVRSGNPSKMNIQLSDAAGNIFFKDTFNGKGDYVKDVQLDHQKKGVYFLKVEQEGLQSTKKVIIH